MHASICPLPTVVRVPEMLHHKLQRPARNHRLIPPRPSGQWPTPDSLSLSCECLSCFVDFYFQQTDSAALIWRLRCPLIYRRNASQLIDSQPFPTALDWTRCHWCFEFPYFLPLQSNSGQCGVGGFNRAPFEPKRPEEKTEKFPDHCVGHMKEANWKLTILTDSERACLWQLVKRDIRLLQFRRTTDKKNNRFTIQ